MIDFLKASRNKVERSIKNCTAGDFLLHLQFPIADTRQLDDFMTSTESPTFASTVISVVASTATSGCRFSSTIPACGASALTSNEHN